MRMMVAAALAAMILPAGAQEKKKVPKIALPPDSVYLLESKSLEGTAVPLRDFAGKVALVVNLASR
jgi:hypothetical protein